MADQTDRGSGHLDGTAAPAMHEADASASHGHDALAREVDAGQAVVVALHGHDGGDLPEPVEDRGACDVPRVEDEVALPEGDHHLCRQFREYLAHMGVGDHADADGAAQMAIAW